MSPDLGRCLPKPSVWLLEAPRAARPTVMYTIAALEVISRDARSIVAPQATSRPIIGPFKQSAASRSQIDHLAG